MQVFSINFMKIIQINYLLINILKNLLAEWVFEYNIKIKIHGSAKKN